MSLTQPDETAPMPRITSLVRTRIVQGLACYETPSEVVEAVQKEFGVTIRRQSIEEYDPTKKAGGSLAPKWALMFWETREAYLKETSNIAIAHRAVRLRTLDRMLQKAETMGNIPLAMSLLEQAAKEMGNYYTNRRQFEHSSPDGSMTPPAPAAPADSALIDKLVDKLIG